MNHSISILVASDGTTTEAEVDALIAGATGLDVVEVIDNESRWASRASFVHNAIVVVGEGSDTSLLLRLIHDAAADPGRKPVVAAVKAATDGVVERVLEAGADDIVMIGEGAAGGHELEFAIRKAVTRRQGPSATADSGQLIVVLGPKGGTGKTLTSANLATALAMAGKRVALVDLDLQFGDLGLVLGLDPSKTIYDLAISGGTLDAEKVRAFTAEHSSGLRVLLAPVRPDQGSVVTPDFLRDLYSVLRESHDIVVVDTPPGFNAEVIATIDASSHVCLLGMLDAPSLKNAKLGLETLDLMGYPHERIRLVLNRADTNVGITHADVVRILGKAPDVLVPSTRDVVRAINAAEPIVLSKSRTEAGKAFQALADLFLSETAGSENGNGARPRSGRGLRLTRS